MQNITIRTNGMTFGALELGTGDELVLLLHGFPDNARSMLPLMRQFAACGYRAVAPYLRGYGPTDRAPDGDYTVSALSKDVASLIQALSDRPALVIGNDWGALAAMGAAIIAPERVRACVSLGMPPLSRALGHMTFNPRQWYRCRHAFGLAFRADAEEWLMRDNMALVDELWRRWSPTFDPGSDRIEDIKRTLQAPGAVNAVVNYYRHGLNPFNTVHPSAARTVRMSMRTCSRPTLVLRGARDLCMTRMSFWDAHRAFTGPFQLLELPSVGHFMALEAPDAVRTLTTTFIESYTR
jgi:pimeloyl-ACP methyl ester carboxylesterase